MLLCCSFASAYITSTNPSSLSVDRLNSKIYPICRASLIANLSGRLPQKRFTKKHLDRGCTVPLDFFRQVLSPLYPETSLPDLLCCRFLKTLLVTTACSCYFSLSSMKNLSLLFGFRAACMLSYRCLQMEWWATVTVVAIPSQPALLM